MNTAHHITSTHNPRIKALERLRKKLERDRTKRILIEGTRELKHALESDLVIEDCFLDADAPATDDYTYLLNELSKRGTTTTLVATRVYKKIAYREGSSGILAVGRRPDCMLEDLPVGDDSLYIVMDTVEKPGNLGAVLRSADGAGVTGVIASDERTDLYNPNVIRASLGTIFTVPTVVATADEAIQWLQSKNVQIVVTTPSADTLYSEVDLTGPTAVVVGSEDRGARREWLEAADLTVHIPMKGAADSLNVAQSATVLVYEALRQRTIVGNA
jgi:TrmH family RNA methyltransferase